MQLLSVVDMTVKFSMQDRTLSALNKISFNLGHGERLGIVGESGAGKSITGFAIMRLLSRPGYIDSGQVIFNGEDIVSMDDNRLRQLRGNSIAMIFQDPMVTLNPVLTIGQQMVETILAHRKIAKSEAQKMAIRRLKDVHISAPTERMNQYPHQLSGGMRQRIIIAIALLLDPELIIADEPTTALDVTIQADIIELLLEMCKINKVGLILITHDLGVVSQMTERTLVMYAGNIIESGKTRDIIDNSSHPYTRGLINALPQQVKPGEKLQQIPGNMPSLYNTPSGCPFHPRCRHATDLCTKDIPTLKTLGNFQVACHMAGELDLSKN